MRKRPDHQRLVLRELLNGRTVTGKTAWAKFGCYRLSSCICRLRKQGYNIKTTIRKSNGNTFAEYKF